MVPGLLLLAGARDAGAKPLVPEDDKRVVARRLALPGASGPLQAYYARPATLRGKAPGVLLVHESRGRTEYVEDVARRLAVAGYLALAPDFLSPRGGTPAEAEKARELAGALESDQATADAVAALVWLKGREEGSGKAAAVGFAWGGGIVGRLAVVAPTLDAGVVFYGRAPQAKDAGQVKTPLLFHHAADDPKVAEAAPAFEAALKGAGLPFESHTYAGVGSSFHNDTADTKFNAPAAQLAWERTLAFLKQRLS
jgi:carboxymethylenebutenolidase